MSNNHNFNHFTGKKKSGKQTKRKKHKKVQRGHKNKYSRFCKAPEVQQSNLYWDTFSKEEKALVAREICPRNTDMMSSEFDNFADVSAKE